MWERRERTQASDFNAALHDHGQYLQRQKQAEERRAAYEAVAEASPSGAVSQDLSLKPGETIRIRLGGKVSSGTLRHQVAAQPASARWYQGQAGADAVPDHLNSGSAAGPMSACLDRTLSLRAASPG